MLRRFSSLTDLIVRFAENEVVNVADRTGNRRLRVGGCHVHISLLEKIITAYLMHMPQGICLILDTRAFAL